LRLTARILLLVLTSAVAFMALAMLEEWPVFEPWIRGQERDRVLPENAAVERVLEEYAAALAVGRTTARENSTAWLADGQDRMFRAHYGINQNLELQSLEVESLVRIGARSVRAITREHSRLAIARPDGEPRIYEVEGTWQYTLAIDDGLSVIDVLPEDVELLPVDGATP